MREFRRYSRPVDVAISGKPLGGIGVSGAPSEVDEKCAQAAIDAVASELSAD